MASFSIAEVDSADLTIWLGANQFDNTERDGPAWPDKSDAALSLLKLGPRFPWWRLQYAYLLGRLSASPISCGDTREYAGSLEGRLNRDHVIKTNGVDRLAPAPVAIASSSWGVA
jgi:hypothetical protein